MGFLWTQLPAVSELIMAGHLQTYLPVSSLETISWTPNPAAMPGTWTLRSGPAAPVPTQSESMFQLPSIGAGSGTQAMLREVGGIAVGRG